MMVSATAAAEEMARAGAAAAAGLGPSLGMPQGEGFEHHGDQGGDGLHGGVLDLQGNGIGEGAISGGEGGAGVPAGSSLRDASDCDAGVGGNMLLHHQQQEVGNGKNTESGVEAMRAEEPRVMQAKGAGAGVARASPGSAGKAAAGAESTTPDKVRFPPHLADMQAVLLANPDTFTVELVDYSSLVKTASPVVQSPSKVRSIPRASFHAAGSPGGANY
jgi:hypothetical protein